jgi:hypothetical protein
LELHLPIVITLHRLLPPQAAMSFIDITGNVTVSVTARCAVGVPVPLDDPAVPNANFQTPLTVVSVTYPYFIASAKWNVPAQQSVLSPVQAQAIATGTPTQASTSNPANRPTVAPSPAPPVSADTSNSGGLSVGPVAGIAIACIVVGALIGLGIAFMLKRRQPRHEITPITIENKPLPPKTQNISTESIVLSRFLLEATPDKEVAGELQSLGQLVQQHVENSYHLQPVQVTLPVLVQALHSLGLTGDANTRPEDIAALALEPRSRHVALQHVISQVMFNSVDFTSKSRLSLLPAPVAAFLQSISQTEHSAGNAEGRIYQLCCPSSVESVTN